MTTLARSVFALLAATALYAQDITIAGSLRSRVYFWDWF
jgi:hypothetical protein